MKHFKRVATIILCAVFLLSYTAPSAHSGRTDSSGGHHDYKNKSGLGSYHYHCGGHPAHLHKNGVCPYSSSSSSSSSSTNSTSSSTSKYYKASVVKKVQKALNKQGYDCGKVDGKCGKKTKKAIKKYQVDKDMKVDGKITKKLLKKLKIEI